MTTRWEDTMDRAIKTLQRKLEKLELEHLRQHALELHTRLEQAESELDRATESANFWQDHAMELQRALSDDEHATHRCVGITKQGELMVVQQ